MDPATGQYNTKTFLWSSTELTPRELAENYQDLMPFVIVTTTGYMGREEAVDDVPSDEVFWVRSVILMPRVIVVNKENNYFSIPFTFKAPVIALKNGFKVGKSTTLKKLIDHGQYRSFMFLNNVEQYFNVCGKGLEHETLNIVDTYNDSYLLVHALGSDGVYKEATIIPVYMPITVVIAVGLNSDSIENFFRSMLEIHNFVDKLSHEKSLPSYITDCKDIVMFHGKPEKDAYGTSELYSEILDGRQYVGKQPKSAFNIYTTMNSVKQLKSVNSKTPFPSLALRGCKKVNVKPKKILLLQQQVLQKGFVPPSVVEQVMEAVQPEHVYTSLAKAAPAQDDEGRKPGLSAPDSHKIALFSTKSTFRELKDVPTNLSRLSTEDVARCLELLNLSKYAARFKQQHVDGCLLADLDGDMFHMDFGLSRFEAIKLVKFVKGWRPKEEAPCNPDTKL